MSFNECGPFTEDFFLGGRVRVLQPANGFRSGIEPVLLAAAIPARAGEGVLEGGCGSGVGLLCLAARVSGLTGVGVDREPALAALAQRNALANGWSANSSTEEDRPSRLSFRGQDLCEATDLSGFDHAFANPPYHQPDGTLSPSLAREEAKRAHAGLLTAWIEALAAALRHHGTLTLVLPTWALPNALTAMADARCPARSLLPLWRRAGQPAKLALVQGVRHGRSPLVLLPGLVLHGPGSAFTAEAEGVLRWGHAISMS